MEISNTITHIHGSKFGVQGRDGGLKRGYRLVPNPRGPGALLYCLRAPNGTVDGYPLHPLTSRRSLFVSQYIFFFFEHILLLCLS